MGQTGGSLVGRLLHERNSGNSFALRSRGDAKRMLDDHVTWIMVHLKMSPCKRRFILKTISFRFHVNLWGCMLSYDFILINGPPLSAKKKKETMGK